MMLPQAHELAMRHYVLMQAFVRGAISSLDRYDRASEPGGTPDPELDDLPARAFLCLVMFARRMQYSTDTVGGLYFKNRIAEEIVSRCYYSYRKLYYDRDIKERAIEKRHPELRGDGLADLAAERPVRGGDRDQCHAVPDCSRIVSLPGSPRRGPPPRRRAARRHHSRLATGPPARRSHERAEQLEHGDRTADA